jgi:hypothetical protein
MRLNAYGVDSGGFNPRSSSRAIRPPRLLGRLCRLRTCDVARKHPSDTLSAPCRKTVKSDNRSKPHKHLRLYRPPPVRQAGLVRLKRHCSLTCVLSFPGTIASPERASELCRVCKRQHGCRYDPSSPSRNNPDVGISALMPLTALRRLESKTFRKHP